MPYKSTRGQYRSVRIGQRAPVTTVYVEREPASTGAWIAGTIVIGGALLWAGYQSHQIAQLYKTSGLPRQSFTETMRESASTSLHGLAERVRPKRSEF